MNTGVKDDNILGCYIVSICKLATSRHFVVLNFQVRLPDTFVVFFSPSTKILGYYLKLLRAHSFSMLNSRYIDTASLQDLQLNNCCGGDEEGDVEFGSDITVLINCVTLQNCWSTRWRSWSKHCATIRKVAGSISDYVVGIFHRHNPFSRTMALGLTQPLTEKITRNISLGQCVGLTNLPPSYADCLEIWEPQPRGTLRACPGL